MDECLLRQNEIDVKLKVLEIAAQNCNSRNSIEIVQHARYMQVYIDEPQKKKPGRPPGKKKAK